MTQQMVWPGEDRLVAVGVATPPLEIASQREPLPVEPTVAAGHPEEDANGTRSIEVEESEVLTSEARIPRPNENETKQTFPMAGSSAESRETALIKEKNPGELQISRFEHPHNEVWLMDKGKRKSALQSLIHLVKKRAPSVLVRRQNVAKLLSNTYPRLEEGY
ncbi:hypothetical protein B0H16DRAFT_1515864 [Mycena metata]|uniref:Uncharacterized protein n=1 Tax=Mycena metata TaxID=1033252 RepID=A0AAD7JS94_9AGAR|nr:hypothetical protein B0H16DRAFT_1515864 [Mycena metata]